MSVAVPLGTGLENGFAATVKMVLTQPINVGDLVVVNYCTMASRSLAGTLSVTDDGGNTYTIGNEQPSGGTGTQMVGQAFCAKATNAVAVNGSNGITVTASGGSAWLAMDAIKASNPATSPRVGTGGIGSGSSSTAASTSVTSTSDSLVVGCVAKASGSGTTQTAGYNENSDILDGPSASGFETQYKITTVGASEALSSALGGIATWCAAIEVFKLSSPQEGNRQYRRHESAIGGLNSPIYGRN